MGVKLAPSILSADFSRLGEQVRAAEEAGVDYIHVDVMDGHFVPNLTMGPDIVAAVNRSTSLPLDVHLMIENPERLIPRFVQAGAHIVTVHQEACPHLHQVVSLIRDSGARPGVAINPATPVGVLEEVLGELDLVLIMAVNPGFGGQKTIPSALGKLRRMSDWIKQVGAHAELEVDGGVGPANAAELVSAGASILVAGSSLFNDRAPLAANVLSLRRAAAYPESS